MAQNEETFLMKEFLVGLFVILIFLVILLFSLQKATQVPYFKNLFTRGQKAIKEATPNFCSQTIYQDIKKDQKMEFERTVKRSGWKDTKTSFILTYPFLEKNTFSTKTESASSPLLNEEISFSCNTLGIQTSEPDKFILAGFLNAYPEKITDYINIQTNKRTGSFLPLGSLDSGKSWEQTASIKGAIVPSNYQIVNEEKYCFAEEAKGTSVVVGSEKLGEIEAVKIETNWEATASAYLKEKKNAKECESFAGDFDTISQVTFKEEVWFAKGLGIIKRRLTPVSVSGQAYLFPNGYQPLTITDEMVSKN